MKKKYLDLRSILYVSIFVFLWVVNLFNGTGLGSIYHTNEIFRIITVIIFCFIILINVKRGIVYINNRDICVFGGIFLYFFIVSLFNNSLKNTFNYLCVYLLCFLLGQMNIDEFTVKFTGIIYGMLGLSILFIFNFMTALDGWNSNSIAMIGMHSFLVFLIPFYKTKHISAKLLLVFAAIAFSFLVAQTDSRSCILFSAIAILFAISIIPKGIILHNRLTLIIWLLLPLLIAIVVSILSSANPEFIGSLNRWSYKNFSKPFFNGRDELWVSSFNTLFNSGLVFLFGTGNYYGNWHNVAISCLIVVGVVGFCIWLYSLYYMLSKSFRYFNDFIVCGIVLSFVIIVVQQSVELGMFSANPHLLPYIMLGMLIGRVNYLRGINKQCSLK